MRPGTKPGSSRRLPRFTAARRRRPAGHGPMPIDHEGPSRSGKFSIGAGRRDGLPLNRARRTIPDGQSRASRARRADSSRSNRRVILDGQDSGDARAGLRSGPVEAGSSAKTTLMAGPTAPCPFFNSVSAGSSRNCRSVRVAIRFQITVR